MSPPAAGPEKGGSCRERHAHNLRSPRGSSDKKGKQMSRVTELTQNGHPEAPPAEAAPRSRRSQGRPRVLTHPQDVMALVLRQVDTVNATKDELTIALKRPMDLTKQLARAYVTQAQ